MEVQTTRERRFLMRPFSRILYTLFFKPALQIYLKKDRRTSFDGFSLVISKGVFHPKFFFSTRYFYSFLKTFTLKKLRFLEIGSGSGILSLLAYREGAIVYAIDIDEKAVNTTRLNFSKNFKDLSTVFIYRSDLFDELPIQKFDVITINPPYYFKKVESSAHYAWYCGENGEYFERLFSEIASYMHKKTEVFMILEENAEIDRIKSIALKNAIRMELKDQKKIRWETNYIFKLSAL